MDFTGIIFAIITVLAWGTWLAPSQNVSMKGQQTRTLYTTVAVMIMALVAALFVGFEGLNATTFWFPFFGGLIWAVSGWSSFVGASNMGMAKAFGIWAPMNIVVGILWGMILFGEFLNIGITKALIALVALMVIILGILMIIRAGGSDDEKRSAQQKRKGLMGAVGAGIGFASYFIPIQIGTANNPDFNMWIGTLPLSLGMVCGAVVLVLVSKSSLKLDKGSDYFRVLSSGFLWGIGNYGALVMMEKLGTGTGFTIAQLCVVVNALVGIYFLNDPAPRTKAANITLIGVLIAIIGATVLGSI